MTLLENESLNHEALHKLDNWGCIPLALSGLAQSSFQS